MSNLGHELVRSTIAGNSALDGTGIPVLAGGRGVFNLGDVAWVPDVAFITLGMPSGVLANIELSWLAPSKLRRTVLVGSKKMVVYDDGSPEPVRIFDHGVVYEDPETFGQYHLSYRTGDIVSPKLDTAEPIAVELGDFVAAINGASTNGHLNLAVDVVRLVEAAEESMQSRGAEISLRPSLSDARDLDGLGV